MLGVGAGLGRSRHVPPEYGFDNAGLFLRTSVVANPSLQVVVIIASVMVTIRLLPDVVVFVRDVGFKIVLVVGIICRYFDHPASSLDGSNLLPWHGPLPVFLRAAAFSLEVSLLAAVKAGNVGFVPVRARVLLGSIYIHGSSVVPISRATVLSFALIVGWVGRYRPALPFALLFTSILSVVDPNSHSDIGIEVVRPVLLIQLVLDSLLQAVVEQLYQSFVVNLGPKGVLSESRGVYRYRLDLL